MTAEKLRSTIRELRMNWLCADTILCCTPKRECTRPDIGLRVVRMLSFQTWSPHLLSARFIHIDRIYFLLAQRQGADLDVYAKLFIYICFCRVQFWFTILIVHSHVSPSHTQCGVNVMCAGIATTRVIHRNVCFLVESPPNINDVLQIQTIRYVRDAIFSVRIVW